MDSLCHPWFTTTKLFYRFLILKLLPPPCAALLVDIQDTFGSNLCDRKTHIGPDDFQEFISWPFLACTLQSSLAMCGSKPHIFVDFACHLAANLVISKFWTVESWSFLGMNLSNFVCFSIVKLKKLTHPHLYWPIHEVLQEEDAEENGDGTSQSSGGFGLWSSCQFHQFLSKLWWWS